MNDFIETSTPFDDRLQPLTPALKGRLAHQWDEDAQDFMQRKAKAKSMFGNLLGGLAVRAEDRIGSNPLLVAAIEEIRDGYHRLLNEGRQLREMPERHQENAAWNARDGDLYYDLTVYHGESLTRLQKPDFGYSPARKAAILQGRAPRDATLTADDARTVLGSIVKRSLSSFRKTFDLSEAATIPLPKRTRLDEGEMRSSVRKDSVTAGWYQEPAAHAAVEPDETANPCFRERVTVDAGGKGSVDIKRR